MSEEERAHINSLDPETSNSIKERLALENRKAQNDESVEKNKQYTDEEVKSVGDTTENLTNFKKEVDRKIDEIASSPDNPLKDNLPKDPRELEKFKNRVAKNLLLKGDSDNTVGGSAGEASTSGGEASTSAGEASTSHTERTLD